jgi:hypothetical protein
VEDPAFIAPHYRAVEKMGNVYFWVDDARGMCEELVERGATIDYETIDYELCAQPYGCLEFGIQDLDGYGIAFCQDLEQSGQD